MNRRSNLSYDLWRNLADYERWLEYGALTVDYTKAIDEIRSLKKVIDSNAAWWSVPSKYSVKFSLYDGTTRMYKTESLEEAKAIVEQTTRTKEAFALFSYGNGKFSGAIKAFEIRVVEIIETT